MEAGAGDEVPAVPWEMDSRMVTESRSGFKPHTVEYVKAQQVNVPNTYELQQVVAAAEKDSSTLTTRFTPASTQIPIEHVFSNALHLLSSAAKAGSRRIFYITNQDDPQPGKEKQLAQKACIDRMKDMYRRGVDLEPFFMSSQQHTFRVNMFYAEIVGAYDDGLVDDALRPWRLRQMQDQNGSKRRAWDSTLKFQELDEQMGGREMPKRVIFDLMMDLGPLSKQNNDKHAKAQGASHWRIHVKGYVLISEATKDMPVRVSSYGQENPDDLHEVMAYQHFYDAQTGERVQPADIVNAYPISEGPTDQAQVVLSDDEVKKLRTFGCIPGVKLLGFKDRSTLHFLENIKHAYFLYPSDLDQPGSKRVFAALLQSMLSKNKYALGLYMPRENVIPAFVAILPQAEEIDEEGSQLVPPGMNMIVLPYADDIRDAPQVKTESANAEEVGAAGRIIDSFLRKAPLNPDAFTNPALHHHYGVLMALAFGSPVPSYQDTILPDYTLIDERAGTQIRTWNEAIEADERTALLPVQSMRKSDPKTEPFDPSREKELRDMHKEGILGRLLVADLRSASNC
ncbi:ATP-dependent DNA helicase II subunit 1 [Malassezia brasiliensis]|uniref:ATP-dependent DNA helicase II subunit 1 n=1 Tax=Malassezia brasiliensis TaxID=1821822 RepID=A0AAF0IP14_9BASI|nr:ATP-dependent DNA helicase II subunit 1 [Malassezia brasiliensis]